jgi:hypothetical protein
MPQASAHGRSSRKSYDTDQSPELDRLHAPQFKTGLYYCKGSSGYKRRNAAIWPTKHGAAAAKGHMKEAEKFDWQYVEFELVEKTMSNRIKLFNW